ncbi:MAG: hypothetical protein IJ306_06190 [Oscillospiraceae bacterium]|nr:hypothetical protein [Oscillospiraceae bacterium]
MRIVEKYQQQKGISPKKCNSIAERNPNQRKKSTEPPLLLNSYRVYSTPQQIIATCLNLKTLFSLCQGPEPQETTLLLNKLSITSILNDLFVNQMENHQSFLIRTGGLTRFFGSIIY